MKMKNVLLSKVSASFQTSPLFRQSLVASGPFLCTVSLGIVFGYSAILLPQLNEEESWIKVDQDGSSWIASVAVLPMTFATLLGAFFMEQMGRRTNHLIATVPCFLGWITIALSTDFTTLLVGRFLTGTFGGLLGSSTGVYISETSDPKHRSLLLAAMSLAVALGLFLAHLLGTFFHWTTVAWISSSLPVISAALLLPVPESPAWLAKKGREEAAQKAFSWCKAADTKLEVEVDVTTTKLDMKSFTKKEFWKPLIIISVFITANQWAGINAVSFYSVSIMKQTIGGGLDEYLAMLIVDLIRLIMSVVACLVMKSIGRRPLALISGIGTFTSLFALSLNSYLTSDVGGGNWYYAIIPLTSLVVYIGSITIGFVPLPWAMMGEVFPLESRNIGSSLCCLMAFLAFFSVIKTGPLMFEELGSEGTFLVYGAVALLGTVFNVFFLPETKDKKLHEIEHQFRTG